MDLHIQIFDNQNIRIKLPVNIVGSAIGVRNGGRLSFNIRKLLVNKYGRHRAKRFMPDTYLLQDKEDLFRFRKYYDPTKLYILIIFIV